MALSNPKLVIYGSCVSRDAFGGSFEGGSRFELIEYVARSSLASAFCDAEVQGVDFNAIASPFQRKMVEYDVRNGLRNVLETSSYDLILLDPIDERFDLFVDDAGAVCTMSNELMASGFSPRSRSGRIVKSASEEFFRLWEKGWSALVVFLRGRGLLEKLYINKVFWSKFAVDGSNFHPSYTQSDIERANEFLTRLYVRMQDDIPANQFIDFDEHAVFLANQNHKWGKSPFHYIDEYYMKLLGRLDQICSRSRSKESEKVNYAMISVDVEALPGRAKEDHVNRLIYGTFDGGRYGISRLCEILEERDIRATFFVDFACCCLHGDEGIFEAARLLRDRGHDVQLHMHSEVYVRKLLQHLHIEEFPSFEALPGEVAKEIIGYGMDKFEQALGYKPKIFRPGGMKKNDAMYRACKELGLTAVSATYRGYDRKAWGALANEPVARFCSDTIEIPLDQALDPLVYSDKFEENLKSVLDEKGLVSYLIHSWSILYRDPREPGALFTHYSPDYEESLCRYLDIARRHAKFITHSELLSLKSEGAPLVNGEFIQKYVAEKSKKDENIAMFGCNFSHLDESSIGDPNDYVSPTLVPIKLAAGQRFRVMVIADGRGNSRCLSYVVSGRKLYVQTDRLPIPFSLTVDEISHILKYFNESVGQIIFGRIVVNPSPDMAPRGRGFILDLPDTIDRYSNEVISSNLISEIRRERRRMSEDDDRYEFLVIEKGDISKQLLRYARQISDDSILAKGNRPAELTSDQWVDEFLPYYQRHGRIALCRKNGVEIAVATAYEFDQDLYLMSSGFFVDRSRYGIGKHLFVLFVEYAIERGFKRFCLGGGDFGYKERMGAVEYSFFSLTKSVA